MNKLLPPANALVLAFGMMFSTQAYCQSSPKEFDIIGLKLGMSLPDASETLKQYNAAVDVHELYATDNRELLSLWGDRGYELPRDQATVAKSKIKIPIALIGILKGSGSALEVFNLRFTPTDDGGRLYAIARTVTYAAPGETPEELAAKFISKYGKPTSSTQRQIQDFWEFDIRGRKLSEGSREAFRCQSGVTSINYDGIDRMPWFELMNGNLNQFKQCGTQLQLFSDFNGQKITGFIETLSDQNAVGYDNGIQKYVQQKMNEAGETEPVSSSPKL